MLTGLGLIFDGHDICNDNYNIIAWYLDKVVEVMYQNVTWHI
jgi:hypothetical protein